MEPFYGPLINQHLKTILNSGLLLDEDLEVLLNNYQPKRYPPRSNHLEIIPGILTATFGSCLIVSIKYRAQGLAAVCAAASAASVCLGIKRILKRKRQKEIVHKLRECLIKIQRQNNAVFRYMKTRDELKHKGGETLVAAFVKTTIKIDVRLFGLYMRSLSHFRKFRPELDDDLEGLRQINFEEILDANAPLESALRLRDLHVLFASKFLSYLGITLCEPGLGKSNLEDVLEVTSQELLGNLQRRCEAVRCAFDDLRYAATRVEEIKSEPPDAGRTGVSGKLHNTLAQSVNNLCVIVEKARVLLNKLEEEPANLDKLGADIVDIRDHTLATYETLDVLCRLYGILSHSKKNRVAPPPFKAIKREEDEGVKVNFDDVTEPMEERFELYIGDNEKIPEGTATRYDDQSGQYLGLMLRELKQSLKQHERFISAKQRRGSSSSSSDDDEEVQSAPKFDLRALNPEESDNKRDDSTVVAVKDGVSEKVSLSLSPPPLPPLPPPAPALPEFNLNDLQEESGFKNSRTMLQNIKALSSQINAREEVFGDSFEDSDDSN